MSDLKTHDYIEGSLYKFLEEKRGESTLVDVGMDEHGGPDPGLLIFEDEDGNEWSVLFDENEGPEVRKIVD